MSGTKGTKASEHHGRVVEKEIRIAASPEDVWDAWADPEKIAAWFVDRAEGRAAPGEVMTWHFDDMGMHLPVPIVTAERGSTLVIAGEMPERLPFCQEVTVRREGGETVLRIVNSGFREGAEWDDEYEGVVSGWELALATLKHWLEHHSKERRGHVLAMRPAGAFAYEAATPLFTTSAGLERWLASRADLGGDLVPGCRVELELVGGGRLTGRCLARSAREVLLSWDERRAVLGLKAFSLGPAGRAVGLDLSAWPLADEERAELRATLEAAADRLAALVRPSSGA